MAWLASYLQVPLMGFDQQGGFSLVYNFNL